MDSISTYVRGKRPKDIHLFAVAARSKVLFAAARLLRLGVRIPPAEWISLSRERCVLSGMDLCDGLIPRPEESY